MDSTTRAYYQNKAWSLLTQYSQSREVNGRHFAFAFPKHLAQTFTVLDVGAGTGRDLLLLLESGYDAYGIEPIAEMRDAALSQSTALKGRLFPGTLGAELDPIVCKKRFHGVLCSAVLQHLERSQLVSACLQLKSLLLEGGRLFLSVPAPQENQPLQETNARDEHGRIFNRWHPDFLILLFGKIGLRLVDKWHSTDALGRSNAGWNNFVFSLEGTERKGGLESF